jgi:hypothetical protein
MPLARLNSFRLAEDALMAMPEDGVYLFAFDVRSEPSTFLDVI